MDNDKVGRFLETRSSSMFVSVNSFCPVNCIHRVFNGIVRWWPRLPFSGPEQSVEDGTESVDACRYVEHRPPRLDRLLAERQMHAALHHTI